MGPVLDDGFPEGVEEREEEAWGQREEEGGEGFGEALLGYGSVGVEDACARKFSVRCWSWRAIKGGECTEEEAFPDLEKLDSGEGAAGAEVGCQGGESFFSGWAVCWMGLLAMFPKRW